MTYNIDAMGVRLLKWGIFGVAFPLFPLGWSWVIFRIHGQSQSFAIASSWEHGELLLISIVITAAGLGELVSTVSPALVFRVITGGLGLLVFLGAVLLYGEIAACVAEKRPYDISFIRNSSPWAFFLSCVFGVGCVLLSTET